MSSNEVIVEANYMPGTDYFFRSALVINNCALAMHCALEAF